MSKVAFCNENCSKLLKKTKTFFVVALFLYLVRGKKYANCTTKSEISKHFCALNFAA